MTACKLMLFSCVVFVLWTSTRGLPHTTPPCSSESKQLTQLVANISSHVERMIAESQVGFGEFSELATVSLNELSKQSDKISQIVRLKDSAVKQLILNIADSNAILDKTRREITEVELASKDLEAECGRAEDLHTAQQTERQEVLRLVRSVREIVLSEWNDDQQSTQTLLSTVVSVLPQMHSGNSASFQSLLQSASSASKSRSVSSRDELLLTLDGLVNETLKEIENEVELMEERRGTCKATAEALRLQNKDLNTKGTDAVARIAELTTQREVREEELGLLKSNLSVLATAAGDKKRVLSEANLASSVRQKSLGEQSGALKQILNLQLCCMCNNNNLL